MSWNYKMVSNRYLVIVVKRRGEEEQENEIFGLVDIIHFGMLSIVVKFLILVIVEVAVECILGKSGVSCGK